MVLSNKTLEELKEMINEKTTYRSGPVLVSLFNTLGFHDSYGQGFHSRKDYTYSKLQKINGTPDLYKCIKQVFAPINFINNKEHLLNCINVFNEYIAFDGWNICVKGRDIEIHSCDGPNIEEELKKIHKVTVSEDDFIKMEFKMVDVEKLPITESVKPIISSRLNEIEHCFEAKAYLATIIISGSVLEGILLGIGQNCPKLFNQSKCSPKKKDTGDVRPMFEWTLSDLINTAHDIGFIKEDVKKFSHVLREFRNYIHPFQQMSTNFFQTNTPQKSVCRF